MDTIIESTPLFYGFVLLFQAIPGLHYTVITLTCVIIVQQILLILGGNYHLYTLIIDLLVYQFPRFFLQKLIFNYINEKKLFLQALNKTYKLNNF